MLLNANPFLDFLSNRMNTPTMFGWFHLLFLAIVITSIILLAIFAKNFNDKQNRILLFSISIVLVVLEIYKQLIYSYNDGDWTYKWYAFPFQFCSVPMYVMLLASLIKEGKFKSYLYAFLGTYTLFAGIAVMIYTGDVFTSLIGVNIQTMVHHGSMAVVGFHMYTNKQIKLHYKSVLKATAVFAAFVAIAFIFNEIAWALDVPGTFNMFFISRHYPCTLPLLSMFYGVVPYIVFLLIYILGFGLCATIVFSVPYLIEKIKQRKIKNT